MIAIPNIDKPRNAFECSTKINPEERMCIYTGKVFEETLSLLLDRPCDDCPLIDIVRCGECVKANTKDCSHSYWDDDWGEWRIGYKDDDWFCADGERRSK